MVLNYKMHKLFIRIQAGFSFVYSEFHLKLCRDGPQRSLPEYQTELVRSADLLLRHASKHSREYFEVHAINLSYSRERPSRIKISVRLRCERT